MSRRIFMQFVQSKNSLPVIAGSFFGAVKNRINAYSGII
jgi:hypothetical protein